MVTLSENLLYIAFVLYLISIPFFAGAIKQKKNLDHQTNGEKWAKAGIVVAILGFIAQLGFFFARWSVAGHAPVSNLFEFTTFFGMCLVGAFIVIYFIYRTPLLGLFSMPMALLVIAFASMFPTDISPLIPALQSDWLHIHVTTVALGEAILAVSFGAALIYLVKVIDQSKKSKRTAWLEVVMYGLIATLGFVLVVSVFSIMDYKADFNWVDKNEVEAKVE